MKTQLKNCSFRDPSGFVFVRDGEVFRQINRSYQPHFDLLIESGLYSSLLKNGKIVSHEETAELFDENSRGYKVIRHEKIPFISYPYEWCFSQFRDAALLTLDIEMRALKKGMCLKDASAYNVQFIGSKPVFIDTLSFEKYTEGEPWIAYKQFCQHFLAPLVLMKYHSVSCAKMAAIFLDGIDLGIASSMLPFSTKLSFSLLAHIHLHAGFQKKYSEKPLSDKKISLNSRLALIDSLKCLVTKMDRKIPRTQWGSYYTDIHYSDEALNHKKQIVESFVKRITPQTVFDLGGNAGVFSRIASKFASYTVSTDLDPEAVELNYTQASEEKERTLLPLVIDLANPSPAIGWQNSERSSFVQRGPADMIMALALVHHLVISNNCTFNMVAEFFASLCRFAIVEFIPYDDKQIKLMLSTRKDIAHEYNQDVFESAFGEYFTTLEVCPLHDSGRKLYLFKKR